MTTPQEHDIAMEPDGLLALLCAWFNLPVEQVVRIAIFAGRDLAPEVVITLQPDLAALIGDITQHFTVAPIVEEPILVRHRA